MTQQAPVRSPWSARGACALLLVLCACGRDPVAPSTERMAARLRALAAQVSPDDDTWLNAARADALAAQVEAAGGPGAVKLGLLMQLAHECLLAGRTERAIALFEDARARLEGLGARANPASVRQLRRLLILAYLRLGEQQNCLEHHGAAACVVPVAEAGVHRFDEGSRRASALLLEALADDPQDWEARWLLNLAAMTLGTWPEGVPPAWRIPPEAFESTHDLGRFENVAARAGTDRTSLAGGVCTEDFDGDGRIDVLLSSWGLLDPMTYLRNAGDGTFEDRTAQAGLEGLVGGLNMLHADPDNDGDADVLVLRGGWFEWPPAFPNSLLANDGAARFADVTEEAGLGAARPTQTAAWGDFDGDGWLDLFVGNETGAFYRADGLPRGPFPCELFHNDGDGTFTEMGARAGVDLVGYVKGVVWGDVDDDGDLDLYVSRIDGDNALLRNDGPADGGATRAPATGEPPQRRAAAPARPWRFVDVAARAGVTEPQQSFPTWMFDYDDDGRLDVFVSGYGVDATASVAREYAGLPHKGVLARLYRNRGDGTFDDVSEEVGLARMLTTMGGNFGDLDADGWLDIYCGTGEPDLAAVYPNRAFRNDAGRRFDDVTTSGGFGHVQKGHGIAFADLDEDGDEDVYAVMGGAYSGDVFPDALFRNPSRGQRWITLRLEGVQANRCAIGARVGVTLERADGSTRTLHRTVGTGGSFGSSSLQLEIGLGDARAIRRLEIRWPGSGTVQVLEDVRLDGLLHVREGDAQPRWTEPRPMPL